jgi:CheY-like chemotaxis protein
LKDLIDTHSSCSTFFAFMEKLMNILSTNEYVKIKKRIMVIEDHKIIRDGMRELLETEGFNVQCAANGHEAIQMLRMNPPLPSLILLDIAMPVKDGFKFREEQQLDENLAHVPVLVMTAEDNVETKAQQLNAVGFIRKPFDIDYIVKIVRQHCI